MSGERIGNSNQFLQISGVVSAPAYSWASDNDTGFYRIAANNIGVAANGAKVLDISPTAVTITPATTLSAALTYGGVTLSNSVQGTGAMVLSTSPTLTTPALGTPSSGLLTNCTGLPNAGLLYSSVTIGSTSVSLGGTAATVAGLTLTAPVVNTATLAAYRETTVTNAAVTGTYTVDMAVANVWNVTQTGSTTYTFSNPAASGTASNFLIAIKQGGAGSYTATWPASVKFPNGSTPVLSTTVGKVDILNFITFDGGTTYYGSLSLANM